MKKHILSVVLAFFAFAVFSQTENQKIDGKFRFGFNLATNYSLLRSEESLTSNSKIYGGIGARLGVFMEYSISEHFIFSPKTEFAFNKSGIETTNSDQSKSKYRIFPYSIDFMTHFLYKFGDKKTAPYLLLGPNFRLPLDHNARSSSAFKNNPDLAIDFGIGLENKFKQFIFAPELRYSLGLLNINNNPTFQTLKYHNVSLVLNFK
jgi:hypothetical protein